MASKQREEENRARRRKNYEKHKLAIDRVYDEIEQLATRVTDNTKQRVRCRRTGPVLFAISNGSFPEHVDYQQPILLEDRLRERSFENYTTRYLSISVCNDDFQVTSQRPPKDYRYSGHIPPADAPPLRKSSSEFQLIRFLRNT